MPSRLDARRHAGRDGVYLEPGGRRRIVTYPAACAHGRARVEKTTVLTAATDEPIELSAGGFAFEQVGQ
jgi:hypothetical protein